MSTFRQYWKSSVTEFRAAWQESDKEMSFREFRSEYKADLRKQWNAEEAEENAVIDDIIDPAVTDTGIIDLGDRFITPIYVDDDGTISHEEPNEIIKVDIDPVFIETTDGPTLVDGATVTDDIIDPAATDTGIIDLGDLFITPIYIDDDGTISHEEPNEIIKVDIDPVFIETTDGPTLTDGATTGNSTIYFYDDGTTETVSHPLSEQVDAGQQTVDVEINNLDDEFVMLTDGATLNDGPALFDDLTFTGGATTGNSTIYFYDDGTTETVWHPLSEQVSVVDQDIQFLEIGTDLIDASWSF